MIELHESWTEATELPETWHELRVSVKRFRYMVESFLPEKSEAWGAELQAGSGPSGRGARPGRAARLDREALAQEIFAQKPPVSQSLRRVDAAAQQAARRIRFRSSREAARSANGHAQPQDHSRGRANSQTVWERWRARTADLWLRSIAQAAQDPRGQHPEERCAQAARASRYPRQATPDFFSAVKGAVALSAWAMNSSICGAWPKQITSPVSRVKFFRQPRGLRLGLERVSGPRAASNPDPKLRKRSRRSAPPAQRDW